MDIALELGTQFQPFHQHLMFMLDSVMPKADRRIFNSLSSTSAVVDFLRDYYGVTHDRDISRELSTVSDSSCTEIVNESVISS